MCRKAKQADWRYMMETQNSTESINRLRKILEINIKHNLGILKKPDNTFTSPGKETLEYLLSAHFPSIQPTEDTVYTEYQLSTEDINATQLDWLTPEKLIKVFDIFKNKKISLTGRAKTTNIKTTSA